MQQSDAARQMIEHEQGAWRDVMQIRKWIGIRSLLRQLLEEAHQIIRSVADEPSRERQSDGTATGIAGHRTWRLREGCAQCGQQFMLVARQRLPRPVTVQAVRIETDLHGIAEADERIACQTLAALDALEQEVRLECRELQER